MDQSADGYYYKDDNGVAQGPLDKLSFDAFQSEGLVRPGMKVWRQKAGAYFTIKIDRRYKIGRIFSLQSCAHLAEVIVIGLCLVIMLMVMRAPKLQEELHEPNGDGIFLGVLLVLTVLATLFSIRMNLKRLSNSSSEVVRVEPPV
jgi:hypothetical protein